MHGESDGRHRILERIRTRQVEIALDAHDDAIVEMLHGDVEVHLVPHERRV
jgi:hypothetical protein